MLAEVIHNILWLERSERNDYNDAITNTNNAILCLQESVRGVDKLRVR